MIKLLLSLSLLIIVLGIATAKNGNSPNKSIQEPTSWGNVQGQIYDATTGDPIKGALVQLENDGVFSLSGRTSTKTSDTGMYKCQAVIGRVTSRFDISRVGNSSIIGMIFGGTATATTKRIDISRLNIRVTKDGFKPFEGTVTCKDVVPEKFTVDMSPILLVPESSAHISTSAPGWGVLMVTDVSIDPPILTPGCKAKLTAKVQAPLGINPDKFHINAKCKFLNREISKDLHPQKNLENGLIIYTSDFTIPKNSKPDVGVFQISLIDGPFDIDKNNQMKSVLYQVATNLDEQKEAGVRSEAFRLILSGDDSEAEIRLKEICDSASATIWDYMALEKLSEKLNETAIAADAAKKALDLTPVKPKDVHIGMVGFYALALDENHQYNLLMTEYEPLTEGHMDIKHQYDLPTSLLIALGDAYIKTNNLSEADNIYHFLSGRLNPNNHKRFIQFQDSLVMAHIRSEIKSGSNNAKGYADYGIYLMNHGQWEQAVGAFQNSLKIDPNQQAVQCHLAYSTLHLAGGQQTIRRGLDQAITIADNATRIRDNKGKITDSTDFFAWHTLGILLYAKAMQDTGLNNAPEDNATMDRIREALLSALKYARSDVSVNTGNITDLYIGGKDYPQYMQGSLTSISGFVYPEANDDLLILESLRILTIHPEDYLAYYNLGTAFIDLGLVDFAKSAIQKTLALKPDFVDAMYDNAIISLKDGELNKALKELQKYIDVNPRQPDASLALAKLYTKEGNKISASACLALHDRYYSSVQTIFNVEYPY